MTCDEIGACQLFTNQGPAKPWGWIEYDPIHHYPIASGNLGKLSQIRFAKIFKSGRADYVVVDDKTGAIDVWENGGPNVQFGDNEWAWFKHTGVASGLGDGAGVSTCSILCGPWLTDHRR